MAIGSALSVGLIGLKAFIIQIQAFVSPGLPYFSIIGLPDTSLSEARERVKSACQASGAKWPETRVTVNLSPASMPKRGSSHDLAIAASVLSASGTIPHDCLNDTVVLGEVNLDGTVLPINGLLPILLHARDQGVCKVIVPHANLDEAALVPDVNAIGVRHVGELIELMGGRKGFTQMLDSVFVVPPIYDDSYYGVRIHEITEMQVANMGNYAHGNQPAQHMIYLYDYCGQPAKAQWWAREVMDRLYSPKPDGYCGDEDNGQTSAWYVFSALGFYPVCPASDEYAAGSPLFKKATIRLENGKTVEIEAPENSPENRYVGKMRINGQVSQRPFIEYAEIEDGAKILFDMQVRK